VISGPPLIELVGVSYRYGADLALEAIDLCLHAGDRLVLVGPNGGGKSTLARLLLGLASPSSGTIERRAKLRLGYVPQFPTFDRQFPIRVAEMVLEGRLSDRGWMRPFGPDDRAAADEALERLQLTALRRAYLDELSGGELKRALVARSLVARPELFVLDEPTSSLDEQSRRTLWSLVAALPASTTIVLATHDLAPGTFVPTRAALVDRRLEALAVEGLHEHPLLCGHSHG
jgi:zinc transport system ATP-binding protein